MAVVIAALDTTAAARPVLETALRLGARTGAAVEAVHVLDGDTETPRALAARAGVVLRTLEDPLGPALATAISAQGTAAGVIGARSTPGGRRPVGHSAEYVVSHATKPVIVVAPEADTQRGLQRVLVPLEGDLSSSRPVLEHLHALVGAQAELVVLHVFTATTLPAMLDRGRDLEIIGKEFLARHLPHATRIVFRPGPTARRVLEVAAEERVDLVVLSWGQDVAGGRARVVREVLGSCALPVLLLPVGGPPAPAGPNRAVRP